MSHFNNGEVRMTQTRGKHSKNADDLHRGFDMRPFIRHGIHYSYDQKYELKPNETGYCLGFVAAILERINTHYSIDPLTIPTHKMKQYQHAAHIDPREEPLHLAYSVAGIKSKTYSKIISSTEIAPTLAEAKTALIEAKLSNRGYHAYLFAQQTVNQCVAGEANRGTFAGPCRVTRKLIEAWIKHDTAEDESNLTVVLTKQDTAVLSKRSSLIPHYGDITFFKKALWMNALPQWRSVSLATLTKSLTKT